MTGEKHAPAGMPGEEEIARVLCEALRQAPIKDHIWAGIVESFRSMEAKYPTYAEGFSLATDAFRLARAAQALFAPILAEKDAWAERGWNAFSIAHDQAMANGNAAQLAEARALAAEAARDRTRERCARICDDADKTTHPADLAAAIRAEGE